MFTPIRARSGVDGVHTISVKLAAGMTIVKGDVLEANAGYFQHADATSVAPLVIAAESKITGPGETSTIQVYQPKDILFEATYVTAAKPEPVPADRYTNIDLKAATGNEFDLDVVGVVGQFRIVDYDIPKKVLYVLNNFAL